MLEHGKLDPVAYSVQEGILYRHGKLDPVAYSVQEGILNRHVIEGG